MMNMEDRKLLINYLKEDKLLIINFIKKNGEERNLMCKFDENDAEEVVVDDLIKRDSFIVVECDEDMNTINGNFKTIFFDNIKNWAVRLSKESIH